MGRRAELVGRIGDMPSLVMVAMVVQFSRRALPGRQRPVACGWSRYWRAAMMGTAVSMATMPWSV